MLMASSKVSYYVLLCFGIVAVSVSTFFAIGDDTVQPIRLVVNASEASARQIPDTLFGIFFEVGWNIFSELQGLLSEITILCFVSQEINHAGAGGIWAELVSNRGQL